MITLTTFLLLFTVSAFADVLDPTIASSIQTLFPANAEKIIAILSLIIAIWTQVRQYIPPNKLAKLPSGLIKVLEVLAGNRKYSANAPHTDPIQLKHMNTKYDSDGKIIK